MAVNHFILVLIDQLIDYCLLLRNAFQNPSNSFKTQCNMISLKLLSNVFMSLCIIY